MPLRAIGPFTSSLDGLELSLVMVESLWNEMKGARIVVKGGGDLREYTTSKGGDGGAFVCLVAKRGDGGACKVCTLPTQGMRSIISMVSISPEGFMPSILLLVVIIVTVVIVVVTVILVVVVVAIIRVVIVVMIIGVVVVVMIIGLVVVVVSSISKFLFVIIEFEAFEERNISFILLGPGISCRLAHSKMFGIGILPGQGILGESTSSKFHFAVLVSLGPVFLFGLSVLAMVAACASRCDNRDLSRLTTLVVYDDIHDASPRVFRLWRACDQLVPEPWVMSSRNAILSEQLQELQDEGFIRPSHFPWEHQCRLLRRGAWSSFEIKLYSKYEYEIRYHPNKTNVVIDALRRKERVKLRRVRAMAMTIRYEVRGMMLAAQSEAFKQENVCAERLHGLD
ncbi:hypothetical protein Tco_0285262 [Tanacetum coccineum]